MKVKTSELRDRALAYAVACAEGMSFPALKHVKWPDDAEWVLFPDGTIRHAVEIPSNSMNRQYEHTFWMPHADWAQGGPLLDREEIMFHAGPNKTVMAYLRRTGYAMAGCSWAGPTRLVAACRCYVASELGDEVDIPEELL